MARSTSAGRLCTPSRGFLGVHSGLAIAYQTWPLIESNGPGASTVTVTSYRCFGCGFNSGCAGSPCAMEHPVIKARVKRSATTAAVLGAMVQSLRSDWVSAPPTHPRARTRHARAYQPAVRDKRDEVDDCAGSAAGAREAPSPPSDPQRPRQLHQHPCHERADRQGEDP